MPARWLADRVQRNRRHAQQNAHVFACTPCLRLHPRPGLTEVEDRRLVTPTVLLAAVANSRIGTVVSNKRQVNIPVP